MNIEERIALAVQRLRELRDERDRIAAAKKALERAQRAQIRTGKSERNGEIYWARVKGERFVDIARRFAISTPRVQQIYYTEERRRRAARERKDYTSLSHSIGIPYRVLQFLPDETDPCWADWFIRGKSLVPSQYHDGQLLVLVRPSDAGA